MRVQTKFSLLFLVLTTLSTFPELDAKKDQDQRHAENKTDTEESSSALATILRGADALKADLRGDKTLRALAGQRSSQLASDGVVSVSPGGTKYLTEHRFVESRDGVQLYSIIFRQLDLKKRAAVMFRTPYGERPLGYLSRLLCALSRAV